MISNPAHIVGIIGGAVSGSEAAKRLADRGIIVVVFDMKSRPYGKIEDGLPIWHTRLREKYINQIDANLSHPNIHFLPGIRLRELHNCILDNSTNGKYIKLVNTKGMKERIIPIPPEIVDDFKIAKCGPYKYNPEIKEPYKPDYISKTFSYLRTEAGVSSNKTIHSLRHTFALRKLLELGNIYLVMQMLGHADVKTTQIYLEFPKDYLKEVFDK